MKNKKLLLTVGGVVFVTVVCICVLTILVSVLSKRDNTIQDDDEARTIALESIDNFLEDYEAGEKIKIHFKSILVERTEITVSIDKKQKLALLEDLVGQTKFYYTADKSIACFEDNCYYYNETSSLPTQGSPISPPTSYYGLVDELDNAINNLAEIEKLKNQIKTADIEYSKNVHCGVEGQLRCYNISTSIDNVTTTALILVDSNRILSGTISSSGVDFFKLEFEYDFEIKIPEVTNEITSEELPSPNDPFSDARNAQRSADVNVILEAINQYTSEPGNSISDFGSIVSCGIGYDPIGTDMFTVNLDEVLVDRYLTAIPTDPQSGTLLDTGYEICVSDLGTVEVSAPLAENGETILVRK